MLSASIVGLLAASAHAAILPRSAVPSGIAISIAPIPVKTYTYPAAADPGPTAVPEPIAGAAIVGSPDINPNTLYGRYKSVVILSFDGFHQSDLASFLTKNPASTLASVVASGVEFTNAKTSSPSDSFPGSQAYMTGASPRTHGVYYDVAYDRTMYAPGSNCQGVQGTVTAYDETIDANSTAYNGGGSINPDALPMQKTAWGGCSPVYPWNYVRSNNIFEIARQSSLVTAYSDKHPAYTIAQGRSGFGLSESYFPEIGAFPGTVSGVESYDDLHWAALENWTKGNHYNGSTWDLLAGAAPSLYGANFQSLSVAEKSAGYNADLTPSANVAQALQYLDTKLGSLVATMKAAKTYDTTLLIISAKHGQAPIDHSTLRWISADSLVNATGVPVPGLAADDGAYLWLAKNEDAPTAKANLLANAKALGIAQVWIHPQLMAEGFGDPHFDARAPDVVVKTIPGVIYTGGSSSKNAEHGGLNPDDFDVALIVSNPVCVTPGPNNIRISTRSIAPTALKALGLDPMHLDGVRIEATPILPGIAM